jgi:hypothetical protein
MTSVAQSFVLFKTDLFMFHQPDETIDRWFVGGDCAGWFYARLLPIDRVQPRCEPVMEDWGWTFGVLVDDVRISVNVWAFYEIENCWLFGIDPKKRLFRRESSETLLESKQVVCDALESILSAEPRIAKHEWFVEDPWKVTEF